MSNQPSKDGGQKGREFLTLDASQIHEALCDYISKKHPQFARGWVFKSQGCHDAKGLVNLKCIKYVLDETPGGWIDHDGLPAPVPADYIEKPTVYTVTPGETIMFVRQASDKDKTRHNLGTVQVSPDGTYMAYDYSPDSYEAAKEVVSSYLKKFKPYPDGLSDVTSQFLEGNPDAKACSEEMKRQVDKRFRSISAQLCNEHGEFLATGRLPEPREENSPAMGKVFIKEGFEPTPKLISELIVNKETGEAKLVMAGDPVEQIVHEIESIQSSLTTQPNIVKSNEPK